VGREGTISREERHSVSKPKEIRKIEFYSEGGGGY